MGELGAGDVLVVGEGEDAGEEALVLGGGDGEQALFLEKLVQTVAQVHHRSLVEEELAAQPEL